MPSLHELLSLPYNGVTLPPGASASTATLNALDYNALPFSQGILSDDYRFAFYDSPLAKPLRWFLKLDTEDGERYEEQTEALNGVPISEVRCLVWDTTIRLEAAPYGQQLENQTMFSVLPEEVEMNAGDLALLTQPESARTAFNRFTRTSGSAQVLPHWPCSEIVGVWVEHVRLPATAYTATPTGLVWQAWAPEVGARFSVRWKYLPLYAWSVDEQGTLQLGADDKPLPQIGRVHLLPNFDPSKIVD